VEVLIDGHDTDSGMLIGRTHREAPEIDGLVRVSGATFARPGARITARVTAAEGPDLMAEASEVAPTVAGSRAVRAAS
jgi:ribosomal protein S12 methylthiotransferase